MLKRLSWVIIMLSPSSSWSTVFWNKPSFEINIWNKSANSFHRLDIFDSSWVYCTLKRRSSCYLLAWYVSFISRKLIFILCDSSLCPFQELEFSNLFAVLHCIHSFFAAKVACLDPLFLGSQAAASAASSSGVPSKAKYMTWQPELSLPLILTCKQNDLTHRCRQWRSHHIPKLAVKPSGNLSREDQTDPQSIAVRRSRGIVLNERDDLLFFVGSGPLRCFHWKGRRTDEWLECVNNIKIVSYL